MHNVLQENLDPSSEDSGGAITRKTISSRTSLEWSDEVAAEEERLKHIKETKTALAAASEISVPLQKNDYGYQRSEQKRAAYRLAVDPASGKQGHDAHTTRRNDSELRVAQNQPRTGSHSNNVLSDSDSESGSAKDSEDGEHPEHTPKIDLSQFKFPRYSRRVQSKSEPSHTSHEAEASEEVLSPVPEDVEVEEVVRPHGSLPSPVADEKSMTEASSCVDTNHEDPPTTITSS